MNKIAISFLIPINFLFANPFQSTLENEISWLKEETFVITASKVKENIDKTPSSIHVITDKMIEEIGANTIFDIFKMVPGIRILQSNIYFDKISVRGISNIGSEKVLILLDGHSLNVDNLNGGATSAYKQLPIEIIKRVEVIKGPASALYGENAFVALINIITKKTEDIEGTIVNTKLGSSNTKKVNLLHGENYDDLSLVLNLNTESSNGNSVFIQKDDSSNSGNTNPTLSSSNVYLSLINTNGFYLSSNYNSIEEGPKFGAINILNSNDLSKRESYFIELGYKTQVSQTTDIHLRSYYDNYTVQNKWEINPHNGSIASLGYKSDKFGIESLFKIKKDNYQIISGISLEKQRLFDSWQELSWNSATSFIDKVDRTFSAFYSELLYDISKDIRINLGLRYDYYDDFGETLNPRIGLTWKVSKNNNIKMLYGEAFRAPTFAELYNKNNPSNQGNPNLKPEKVKTIEITLENTSINKLETSLTAFYTEIRNIILLENTKQLNKDEVSTKGIEIESKYNLSRGSYLIANYTYNYAKNELTNNQLENVSKHNAFLGLNKRVNKYINLYTDLTYTGEQTRSNTDTREKVPSSIISNATVLIKNFKSKNLSIKISAYNIFDKTTYDANDPFDYPNSGRTYMSQLTYKF